MSPPASPLPEIRRIARSYVTDVERPAHDWHHVQRVEVLAERLLDEHPGADALTVRLAVLLHDIGRTREARGEIDDHATWGASEARDILADRGAAPDRVDAVCHAIRVHRYSNDHEPATREAEVLCNADNLDALGAVGIARCFTEGGARGNPIHGSELARSRVGTAQATGEGAAEPTDEGATRYAHFHEKILDLPERMDTDAARRIAADRAAHVRDFLDRFEREVAADR